MSLIHRSSFAVARINPFWRYAVCLAHRPDLPAIPYWSRAGAEAFADESRAHFPDRETLILHRRWPRRRVDVL